MKNVILASTCFIFSLLLSSSCSPYMENPSTNQIEVGANAANEVIHAAPDPKCGYDMYVPLVFQHQGTEVIIGQAELVNSKEYMHFVVTPQSGISVVTAAVWRGNHSVYCEGLTSSDCMPPVDDQGRTDPLAFQYVDHLSEAVPSYNLGIPLNQIYEANSFAIHAKLVAVDQSGSPIFSQAVWAKGKSNQTGSQVIDYIVNICPDQECEAWIGGSPNCAPQANVVCEVPSLAPGDDISSYECSKGNGQKKFVVCHLPPGNPENMQEICIAESAFDAHIIDFKPLDNPCMGHHSGCHLGACDPCGPGSTLDQSAAAAALFSAEHGCTGN